MTFLANKPKVPHTILSCHLFTILPLGLSQKMEDDTLDVKTSLVVYASAAKGRGAQGSKDLSCEEVCPLMKKDDESQEM
jgi:hypothetical protein